MTNPASSSTSRRDPAAPAGQAKRRATPDELVGQRAMPAVRVAVAAEDFSGWSALLTLLRESFAYMATRIDPPSSLQKMGIGELRAKARTESFEYIDFADLGDREGDPVIEGLLAQSGLALHSH